MQELCAEYKFDWLRVAAQCFQESGLDPDAVSSSGAIGLMQLLPSTGKDMGCEDLHDPEQNLRAGVKYLDWLRTNFFADPELDEVERVDFILAAYNAGPGNVRKWRKLAPERGSTRTAGATTWSAWPWSTWASSPSATWTTSRSTTWPTRLATGSRKSARRSDAARPRGADRARRFHQVLPRSSYLHAGAALDSFDVRGDLQRLPPRKTS